MPNPSLDPDASAALGLRRIVAADGREPGAPGLLEIRPPGSKSIAQRLLLAATLCEGSTKLAGVPTGGDVEACLGAAAALGADLRRLAPSAFELRGRAPSRSAGAPVPERIDVGESGTLARLLSAIVGLGSGRGECTLEPAGSLGSRHSRALFRALESAGVGLAFGAGSGAVEHPFGGWPVCIRPLAPPSTLRLSEPESSQEVSALLFAAAAYPGEIAVEVEGAIPSRPYVELSRATLAAFGVACDETRSGSRTVYITRGPLVAPENPLHVEADASLAAVALTAGCLGSEAVRVLGVGGASPQGDVRVVAHLRAFGCTAGASVDGSVQALIACGPATRAVTLDLSGEPDLAPPLAILAADVARRTGQRSRLRGLATLPGKESDRIAVLRDGLRRAGLHVDASDDELVIGPIDNGSDDASPGRGGRGPIVLDPAGDHRMAFAFGLLGLVDARVYVAAPGCVSKSWPGFWTALEPLGVRAVELARP